MMLFIPIVVTCLVDNPTQCRPIMGPAEMTEVACMDSLSSALGYLSTRDDLYAAGLVCVESYMTDERASGG